MKKTKEEYYQANPLVQARRNYDILEHRIMRLAIANLNPKLKNSQYYYEQFPSFHLSTDEVFAQFQSGDKNDHGIYKRIHSACVNMVKSYIQIGDVKNFTLFPVFHRIKFTVEEGLTIQFHEDMKPFLLNFESGNYTRCYLQLAFELSSRHSLILLELMLQYRGTQKHNIIERRITPEELKFALDVDDNAYKGRINNFKLKVINPAIKEINEKTNYYINPEYKIERGRWRKIKAFVFTMILPNADEEGSKPKIKPKKEEIPILDTSTVSDTMPSSETPPAELYPEQQEPKKTRKRIEDFTKEEAYALAKLLKFKIAEKIAFATLEKYGVKAINWAIKDYQNTKSRGVTINNPAGFILDKIQEYNESEVTAEDIFKLVEKFEAEDEAERKKVKEESERKKAEENAKEIERKANRHLWHDWEIEIFAKNYIKNGNTFVDADRKSIEERGWKPEELLSKPEYMAYFRPDSEITQYIRRKKNKAGDAN